jgi:hypothetical protein
MPRIPRTEQTVEFAPRPQPFTSGEGYEAPGRAMQKLGQGIASLGGAFDAFAEKQDKEAEFDDKLKAATSLNAADKEINEFKETYQGDGADYETKVQGIYEKHMTPLGTELRSKRMQQSYPLLYEQQRAARYEKAQGHGATLRTQTRVIATQNLLETQIGALDWSSPEAAEQSMTTAIALGGKMIDEIPGLTPQQREAEYKRTWKVFDQSVNNLVAKGKIAPGYVGPTLERIRERLNGMVEVEPVAAPQSAPASGGDFGTLTSGSRGKGGDGAGITGWTGRDARWKGLNQFEKAAAMALMEADGMKPDDAKNALGAMINRAAKNGEDLGVHVSRAIYQPSFEPAQQARLGRILGSAQFKEMVDFARKRAAGEIPDPVNGATHFLAHERTMLALEAREPNKYRSWRGWSGFDSATGQYKTVRHRDGSHAFVAPSGAFSYAGTPKTDEPAQQSNDAPRDANTIPGNDNAPTDGKLTRVADAGGGVVGGETMTDAGPAQAKGAGGAPPAGYRYKNGLALEVLRGLNEKAQQWVDLDKARVKKALDDVQAKALQGYPVDEPTRQQLGAAVTASRDPALMQQFTSVVGNAERYRAMQTASWPETKAALAQMEAQYRSKTPTPDEEKAFEAMRELAQKKDSQLETDMLGYAQRTGVVPGVQLDLKNLTPEVLDARLATAQQAAQTFKRGLQGDDIQYFSKTEREEIEKSAKTGADMQGFATGIVRHWGPEHATRAFRELSGKMPELAVAGYMSVLNPLASSQMFDALKARQDPNYKKPEIPAAEAAAAARQVFGDVYDNFPKNQRDAIERAANLLYEARNKDWSKKGLDTSVYKDAVKAVVGERTDKNGREFGGVVEQGSVFSFGPKPKGFLLPPSWAKDDWRKALQSVTPEDLAAAGLPPPVDRAGKPISATRLVNGTFVQVGHGRYMVSLGNPEEPGKENFVGAGQWVNDPKTGTPQASGFPQNRYGSDKYILDLNKLEPILKRREPTFFWKD